MSEMRVGTRELKTNLSKYLRRVKAGETILVTERGKVIGQIVPAQQSLQERLNALKETGFLAQAGGKPSDHEPVIVNASGKQVSDLVVEDRDVDYLCRYQRAD